MKNGSVNSMNTKGIFRASSGERKALRIGWFISNSIDVAPTKTIVNQSERVRTKKRLSLIKKKIPLRKFSTTKQIADIVYFLTTEKSSSITGSSIISDGGWTAGK